MYIYVHRPLWSVAVGVGARTRGKGSTNGTIMVPLVLHFPLAEGHVARARHMATRRLKGNQKILKGDQILVARAAPVASCAKELEGVQETTHSTHRETPPA